MSTRFFMDRVDGDRVVLGKDDSHHLLRVMRAEPGEPFVVLAGGMQYECRLAEVEEGRAVGEVLSSTPAGGEPPVKITLFQGLAKGEKMETVIQHGTELGICAFVPVATARAVVKLEPKKAVERVERWQRIAREASEQSRRGAVPAVAPVASWKEATARVGQFDLALVPWEEGGEPLREVLASAPGARTVAVFIGPEGGLSPEEVALAKERGARPVTLGPRILRTETAGLAAAAAILYALGDLG
ncbi:MAG TPA: 16S rRNA (uracil(1498)-N(3))-methyltransferase [Symbiobacteriaceae bacterium]|jgi:16S rRNA (uracil1498-N3)-methyltransferase|nr:16S rRNA (uracil(1498)-N(3))-methyltransferase [Symbiobacteriaceae bacterium]